MRSLLSTVCASNTILNANPTSEAGVQCSRQFWGIRQQGEKGLSKKAKSDRGQESKRIRKAKAVESRRIKEDRGASLFPHQIVDFTLLYSTPSYFPTCIFRIYISI